VTSTFGMTSLAACPQQPHGSARDTRDAGWRGRRPARAIDLLTISDDLALSHYLTGVFQKSRWTTDSARTCAEGISCLRDNRTAVVVCEASLTDGSWHDAAMALRSIPDAPSLVVVSDDHSLEDEVVALGGYDVLVRPLRESDAAWTVACAWHAWMKQFERNRDCVP
jgi:hypothetical protein